MAAETATTSQSWRTGDWEKYHQTFLLANVTSDTYIELFHSNWTNSSYNDMDFDWMTSYDQNLSANGFNGTVQQHSVSNVVRDVIFTSVAILIMAATIFGNTLVIIAVCTERRLRKVGNSFIVSLALSDLLVGLIVTPLSLSYELLQEWRLGASLCDFWVSMDVICCTASIMNLCAISYDRHNAITRPLIYALKRTPKRAAVMIAIVWFYSVSIAIPPLFGWREATVLPTTQCHVSEDHGYTIYSTFGAFYLPAIVMATLYIRVYRAAKKRQQQWMPGPGAYANCVVKKHSFKNGRGKTKALALSTPKFRSTVNLLDTGVYPPNQQELSDFSKLSTKYKKKKLETTNPQIGFRLMLSGIEESDVDFIPVRKISTISQLSSEDEDLSPTSKLAEYRQSLVYVDSDSPNGAKRKVPSVYSIISEEGSDSPSNDCDTPEDWTPMARRMRTHSDATSIGQWRRSVRYDDGAKRKLTNGSCNNNGPIDVTDAPAPSPSLKIPQFSHRRNINERRGSALDRIKEVIQKRASIVDPHFVGKLQKGLKNIKRERQKNKIYIQQERRAAKTLGIIMSAFVCCWLPFFINALTQPFCKCVPDIIYPIVLWLGYFNSALNPIIYTFFNRDFRRAFSNILRVILCCEKPKGLKKKSTASQKTTNTLIL